MGGMALVATFTRFLCPGPGLQQQLRHIYEFQIKDLFHNLIVGTGQAWVGVATLESVARGQRSGFWGQPCAAVTSQECHAAGPRGEGSALVSRWV